MEDPEKLREEYINHLDCLMINWNNITYKSPEYLELEGKYQEKEVEVKTMNNRLSAIEEMLFDDGLCNVLDKFKKKIKIIILINIIVFSYDKYVKKEQNPLLHYNDKTT